MSISHPNYYRQVSTKQRRAYFDFRAQYPPRQAVVNGVTWEYIDTDGHPDTPPILVLVGGLRVADASFQTTAPLAQQHRVIVPTYPELDTMAALCDGIIGILDQIGIQQIAVLAGSFGGMIAQVLVRRYPDRISKLILSSTGMPDADGYHQQMKLLEMTPSVLSKRMLPGRMLAIMDVTDDQRDFWRAYLNELFNERLSKEDVLSTYRCILDFAKLRLSADDLATWGGQTLIIQAADDETFDATERNSIASLYPNAQVHTFASGGHSPAMTQRDAYLALVNKFLHAN